MKWADSLRKSLLDDVQLYVHEESALFPHPLEVDAFYNDISNLETQVESLIEALAQLRSAQMAGNESKATTGQRGSSPCD
jgi:ubiquinone biosynthesis protein UbiJ